jgi:hypothetical protein
MLIDRLFYRSELRGDEKYFPNNRVITAEPFLDSKMIFALVHDRSMQSFFESKLGVEDFQFLKEAMPETYSLDLSRMAQGITDVTLNVAKSIGVSEHVLSVFQTYPHDIFGSFFASPVKNIQPERYKWLIKTGDVESETSWGSRSVVLGSRTGAQDFIDLLRGTSRTAGKNNSLKHVGDKPILQRFHKSKDFSEMWRGVLTDSIPGLYDRNNVFFAEENAKSERVYARVTFFMLLDNIGGNHSFTPAGEITLRQQPLAHGASDAMYVPFELE